MSGDPYISAVPPPDLGVALGEVAAVCNGPDGFTLDDVLHQLAERAGVILLVLLTLPFLSPVPVPGLSTPFGLAVAIVGVAMMRQRTVVFPAWLRRLRCPPGLIARVIGGTASMLARLRRLVRPRWEGFAGHGCTRIMCGLIVVVCGLLLALPLPIPGSNALPAYAILLTGVGVAQRDGLAIIAGMVICALTFIFFAAMVWALVHGARMLGWS